jgi:hypothetical protein
MSWLINLENKLILWNLSFIGMKILNWHCMQLELNWNSIQFISIQFQFSWIQLNNEFKILFIYKWNANWWKRYWKSNCEYGVRKTFNFFLKSKKTHFHSSLLGNELSEIFVWNSSSDDYNYDLQLVESKVVLLKLSLNFIGAYSKKYCHHHKTKGCNVVAWAMNNN